MKNDYYVWGGLFGLLLFLSRSKSAPPPGGLPGGAFTPDEDPDRASAPRVEPVVRDDTPSAPAPSKTRRKAPRPGAPTPPSGELKGLGLAELEALLLEIKAEIKALSEEEKTLMQLTRFMTVTKDGVPIQARLQELFEEIESLMELQEDVEQLIKKIRTEGEPKALSLARKVYRESVKTEGQQIAAARALYAYVKAGGDSIAVTAQWQKQLLMNYYKPGYLDYATKTKIQELIGVKW